MSPSSFLTIYEKRVEFPIYGVDFTADGILVLIGGGGANHPGVNNHLTCLEVSEDEKELREIRTINWSETEDCPMSLSSHPNVSVTAVGMNSNENDIKEANNLSCRLFDITKDGDINLKIKIKASNCTSSDIYQKVTVFSQTSGKYLATGFSDGRLTVMKENDFGWHLCFPSVKFNQSIQDIDFDANEEYMVITTTTALIILCVHDGSGDIVQVIDSPKLNKNIKCEFIASRYGIKNGQQVLYAAVNPIQRNNKSAYITAWTLRSSSSLAYPLNSKTAKTVGIGRKKITHLRVRLVEFDFIWACSLCIKKCTFTRSPKGNILAYASSDHSIGFVDAATLKEHSSTITAFNFSKNGKYLASASADRACKVLVLPDNFKQLKPVADDMLITSIIAVVNMILFALLVHIVVEMTDQGTLFGTA
ncbi:quinon protein alcohol dehydrogenase-like superfamily [Mycotypha africana]|uniref:quinon protein alcohol dehydrogenase-like superfamily n=1 Tax=Mycotypha africana TaxID=64632 RepID=UPI002301410C|nr:quinon protein alcohol dehydrogenase-like superfamily [Mycotypha africana]KAI8992024.1 quinon protein alcohol dehydrogenase-like superfamily [Mycotypha africana]